MECIIAFCLFFLHYHLSISLLFLIQLEVLFGNLNKWVIMKILVDADAFPNVLKEILLRAVLKRHITTLFIANKRIAIPNAPYVSMEVVALGADEADHRITQLCEVGDLVITADIPLADRIVTKGAIGLDPRGRIYDANTIKHLLAMRNLMEELRNSGEVTGGPSAIGEKTKREFADGLNRVLSAKKIGQT